MNKKQQDQLISTLQDRFEKNMHRHKGLQWAKVQAKLEASAKKLLSLHMMEETGGEPDVVAYNKKTNEYLFIDCSAQSPSGRRSTCYDGKARKERKKFPPKNSAVEMAKNMGIELLSEQQYRELQELGEFDTTTSSWIQTPANVRKLGGAFFCDRRYDTVFVYHNGADSYYAARGFRGSLKV